MNKHELLRLNLQHFSEKESEDSTEVDETNSSDETENTEEQESVDNRIPYDRFKEKVDEVNVLKKRLAKIEEEQEEIRRKELEETEQYKELYEQALETIKQQKEEAINASKVMLLTGAGYDEVQTEMLLKLVEGEEEDEIKASIDKLKETFPVKQSYVDPSAGNSVSNTPESVDGEDVGRSMFESLIKSGKIRGFKN